MLLLSHPCVAPFTCDTSVKSSDEKLAPERVSDPLILTYRLHPKDCIPMEVPHVSESCPCNLSQNLPQLDTCQHALPTSTFNKLGSVRILAFHTIQQPSTASASPPLGGPPLPPFQKAFRLIELQSLHKREKRLLLVHQL